MYGKSMAPSFKSVEIWHLSSGEISFLELICSKIDSFLRLALRVYFCASSKIATESPKSVVKVPVPDWRVLKSGDMLPGLSRGNGF